MKIRVITAICLLLLSVPVIVYSETFVFVAVISVLSAVGVFELLRCLGFHKMSALAIPSYTAAAAVPVLVRTLYLKSGNTVIFAIAFAYMLYILACAMFSKGKITFKDAAECFVGTAYVICGFSCLVSTRQLEHGLFLLIMVLISSLSTDTFAYFSGMLFGKHKLIPEVSPKKTVEGAVGGTVMSTAAFVLCGIVYSNINNTEGTRIIGLIICGAALSVVSQIGDLIASFVKREYDIKDYGNIFPGHGGVLDRFDSVIAVAPAMYLLLSNPEIFSVFK